MSGKELERDEHNSQERVLEVLSDEANREILSSLTNPRTAAEVVDRCDIPSSTVYRKLDTLKCTDLIKEYVTVQLGYGPVSRYKLDVERVEISIDDGDFSIKIEQPARTGDEGLVSTAVLE